VRASGCAAGSRSQTRDWVKKVSQQVVRAIVERGQGVGATVIAEGIQTTEELAALKDLGLRYGQGYLFGRPKDPYAREPVPQPAKVRSSGSPS
jgi:EAL domain-containing protein (putative c-di-GMP-specific phosphodiesterase class I)